jgi:hypothetical protein
MSFIQEFFTSRNNKANNATHVGQKDRLWYDSATNTIRISDGSTPGGLVVSGGGSSSTYGNANVAAYLPGDPTILAVNAAIVTANVGMKSYVDSQVISAGGYNDAAVAAYMPSYTGSLSNSVDIINIKATKANINSPVFTGNVVFNSVTSIQLPAGNTSQRPLGVAGQIRFNSEQNTFEGFTTVWGAIAGTSGPTGFPIVDLGSVTETAAILVDFGTVP